MVYVALTLVLTIVFARSLTAQPITDDEYLTVRNANLASWSGVRLLVSTDIWSSSAFEGAKSGYYRPVASLSYALNRFVCGNTAASYHLWNVLLHALVAACLLRFVTARKIATGARAFATVLLVATMPLVAEPVSWIAGRYDLLGGLFTLLTMEANTRTSRRWLTPLVFMLAMLSKEPFAAASVLVVLDDVFVWRRGVGRELPKYFGLALAVGVVFLLRKWADVPQATILINQAGLLGAYAFAWATLSKLAVVPTDLCFFHTYYPPTTLATVATLGVLAMCFIAAWAWRRRAPSSRPCGGVVLGLLWCVIAMVPGSLTAPALHRFGDRYAYFPLLGAAVVLAALTEHAKRFRFGGLVPPVLVGLAVAQTFRLESRLDELQSEDAMHQATLARDPDNFTTLSLYGNVLARRGEYARAEEVLVHGRRLSPLNNVTGDIDTALSFIHLHQHLYPLAEAEGRLAVAEEPDNPRAWQNLASALVNQNKSSEAVDVATQALVMRPHFADAHVVRAIAFLKLGRFDDAHRDVMDALAIEPSNAQARAMLGRFRARSDP